MFDNIHKQDLYHIRKGRIASRLYVVFLIIEIFVLILYTTQSRQTFTVTIKSPLLNQFENLRTKYSDTLHCPCNVISIPYKKFIHISPVYHQLCYSDFVRRDEYQNMRYYLIDIGTVDFSVLLPVYLRGLTLFCEMANRTFALEHNRFLLTELVHTEVIPQDVFDAKMSLTVSAFLTTMRTDFLHKISLMNEFFYADQYMSGFLTSSILDLPTADPDSSVGPYLIYSTFKKYNINTEKVCSCQAPKSCVTEDSDPTAPSLPAGIKSTCSLVNTILKSSLECWYDIVCLEKVRTELYQYNDQFLWNITSLDSTQPSQFQVNTTVEAIMNALMLEDVRPTVLYDSYYQQCNPSSCLYTEKSNLVFIVTTIIGIFGGISVVLRLLSPLAAKILLKIIEFFKRDVVVPVEYQVKYNERKFALYCFSSFSYSCEQHV